MTALGFAAALLAVPVFGIAVERRLFGSEQSFAFRLGSSGVFGALLLSGEMFLLTGLGLRWSAGALLLPPALLLAWPRQRPGLPPRWRG